MSDIPDGYGVIAGRSRRNAQAALDAAEKAGVAASEVVAVTEGYLVPVSVLDAFHEAHSGGVVSEDQGGDPVPTDVDDDTPTSDWKNAEIRDWAEAQGVDLGGATTKADMLAAIDAAADEKE
jgi:hypothetical protein